MDILNSSLEKCKHTYEVLELLLKKHFDKEATENNTSTEDLKLSSVAQKVAEQVGVKPSECLQLISVYVNQHPQLALKANKIIMRGEERKKLPMTVEECALKHYEKVKKCAEVVVPNEFLKEDEANKAQGIIKEVKLNFQDLAQSIADQLNLKRYVAYHCLKAYINNERPDLIIDLGRHGGLRRR